MFNFDFVDFNMIAEEIAKAEELADFLEKTHRARLANPFNRMINDIAPVPAIRTREEEPQLMIYAYALLVNRLLEKE